MVKVRYGIRSFLVWSLLGWFCLLGFPARLMAVTTKVTWWNKSAIWVQPSAVTIKASNGYVPQDQSVGSSTMAPYTTNGPNTFCSFTNATYAGITYVVTGNTTGQTVYISGDATDTALVQIGGSAPVVPWNVTKCITNRTGVIRDYQVLTDAGSVLGQGALPPGTIYCFTYHGDYKTNFTIKSVGYVYRQDGSIYSTNSLSLVTVGSGDSGWWQDGGSPPATAGVDDRGQIDPENGGGTNIVWNPTADLAKDSTVQQGFSAEYGLAQQGFGDLSAGIRLSAGRLSQLDNDLNSGFAAVNGNLVTIQGNLGTVNTSIGQVKSSVDGLKTTADNIKTGVDTANTKLTSIDGSTASAMASLTNIKSSVADLANIKTNVLRAADTLGSNWVQQGVANAALASISNNEIASAGHLAQIDTQLAVTESGNGTRNAAVTQSIHDHSQELLGQLMSGNTKLGDLLTTNAMTATELGRVNAKLFSDFPMLEQQGSNLVDKVEQSNTNLQAVLAAIQQVRDKVEGGGSNVVGELVLQRSIHEGNSNRLETLVTTAAGMSNLLAGMATNLASLATNGMNTNGMLGSNTMWTLGVGAGVDAKGAFDGGRSNLMVGLADVSVMDQADSSIFKVQLAGVLVDLNPMSDATIAGFAGWLRQLLLWLVTFVFVLGCWKATEDMVKSGASARQASSAMAMPIASSGSAFGMAGLITVALCALPAMFLVYVCADSAVTSALFISPLRSAVPSISTGVWLVDQFVPVAACLIYAVGYLFYRMGLTSTYILVTATIRFLVG